MKKVIRFDEFVDENLMVSTYRYASDMKSESWAEIFNKISDCSKKSIGLPITDMEYVGDGEYIGYIDIPMNEYEKLETKADKKELVLTV
jgi:hypothetical protein